MDEITLCGVFWEEIRTEDAAVFFTPARREKLISLRSPGAVRLSVCAELAYLAAFLTRGERAEPYRYGENGRPELSGGKYLSLCHAGDMGFAALGGVPLGFDAEKTERDITRVERLLRAPGDEGTLAELWTGKEAYLKMTGEGISVPMRELTLRDGYIFRGEAEAARVTRPEIPGYVTALVTKEECPVTVRIFSAKEVLSLLKREEKYGTMT